MCRHSEESSGRGSSEGSSATGGSVSVGVGGGSTEERLFKQPSPFYQPNGCTFNPRVSLPITSQPFFLFESHDLFVGNVERMLL